MDELQGAEADTAGSQAKRGRGNEGGPPGEGSVYTDAIVERKGL